jgi:NitT/TauT family transport system permease protein
VKSLSIDRISQGQRDVTRTAGSPAPKRGSSQLVRWLLPVGVLLIILCLWQAVVAIFGLKPYFIPAPTLIARTFWSNAATIGDNTVPTVLQALTGFAIGNGLAIVLSIWFVHVRPARRALYPLAIILQSIPLVALAPVAIVTLGTGFTTKVVMTGIISFFPTLVNMMRGLDSVEPSLLELFKTVHASRADVLWKLRWPSALPYLFAGLRITASASVVGAIIVEWIGSDTGLGYMVINSTYQFNTPLLWASLVASSALVLIAFGLVAAAERLLVPWRTRVAVSE